MVTRTAGPTGVTVVAYGAFTVLAQVLLFRELAVVFAAGELSIGLALMAWLWWTALGSWRLAPRIEGTVSSLVAIGALAPVLILEIVLARAFRPMIGAGYGETVGLWPMLYGILFLLAPFGLLSGACFTLAAHAIGGDVSGGGGGGRAYTLETIGGTVGGLAATLSAGSTGPMTIAMVGGALLLVAIAVDLQRAAPRWVLLGVAFAVLGLCVSVGSGGGRGAAKGGVTGRGIAERFEAASRRFQWSGYNLVASVDSRYGFLCVTGTGSLHSLYIDGRIASTWPLAEPAEELVHFALLAHPAPRRVLLIGIGATGVLARVLEHPVESVDAVDQDEAELTIERPFLTPDDVRALSDGRVHVHFADPRAYLRESRDTFDVILVDAPAPIAARVNRFFTREFFALARGRLEPGGLLSIALPMAENYIDPAHAALARGVAAALRVALGDPSFVPGARVTLLAGKGASPSLDPSLLARRLEERAVRAQTITPQLLALRLSPERIRFTREALATDATILPNSDLAPVTYIHQIRVWVGQYSGPSSAIHLVILVCILIGIARALERPKEAAVEANGSHSRDARLVVGALVAVTAGGLAGMAIEILLLLLFEAFLGAVYWTLGILFAAFLAGTAAGSAAGRVLQIRLVWPLAGLALVAATLAATIAHWTAPTTTGFAALLALVGTLVGAIFPGAVALGVEVGVLYAADLAGGALGALITPMVLVPLAGFVPTLWLIAFICGLAAALAPREPRSHGA